LETQNVYSPTTKSCPNGERGSSPTAVSSDNDLVITGCGSNFIVGSLGILVVIGTVNGGEAAHAGRDLVHALAEAVRPSAIEEPDVGRPPSGGTPETEEEGEENACHVPIRDFWPVLEGLANSCAPR
jgi:hypothetical protein